jgi:predicted  nucleic acid-binding Zn-ribbon protein
MQNLVKLQNLQFSDSKDKSAEAAKAELRAKIPAPVLGHYDRLIARGKKGLALVREQVCMGCHMRQPMAVVMTLMHQKDIQLCDSCGRYLYLEDASASSAPEPPAAPKPAKRPRKSKKAEPAR